MGYTQTQRGRDTTTDKIPRTRALRTAACYRALSASTLGNPYPPQQKTPEFLCRTSQIYSSRKSFLQKRFSRQNLATFSSCTQRSQGCTNAQLQFPQSEQLYKTRQQVKTISMEHMIRVLRLKGAINNHTKTTNIARVHSKP